jgi:heme-degrading monooxygenase HmoA
MRTERQGWVAVIFAAQRTSEDEDGYQKAAADMVALAERQPGFQGLQSTRGADGFGITISYWADEDAAKAWRDHPDHAAIRDLGRARWYHHYTVDIATINGSYDWTRNG